MLLCVTCVIKGDECIRGSALNAAEHTVEVGPPATPGLPPEICPLTALIDTSHNYALNTGLLVIYQSN